MESKLTPELSVALDRALIAAGTDPLVEALDILRELVRDVGIENIIWDRECEANATIPYCGADGKADLERTQEKCQHALRLIQKARAVLAKYRPLSETDTKN